MAASVEDEEKVFWQTEAKGGFWICAVRRRCMRSGYGETGLRHTFRYSPECA